MFDHAFLEAGGFLYGGRQEQVVVRFEPFCCDALAVSPAELQRARGRGPVDFRSCGAVAVQKASGANDERQRGYLIEGVCAHRRDVFVAMGGDHFIGGFIVHQDRLHEQVGPAGIERASRESDAGKIGAPVVCQEIAPQFIPFYVHFIFFLLEGRSRFGGDFGYIERVGKGGHLLVAGGIVLVVERQLPVDFLERPRYGAGFLPAAFGGTQAGPQRRRQQMPDFANTKRAGGMVKDILRRVIDVFVEPEFVFRKIRLVEGEVSVQYFVAEPGFVELNRGRARWRAQAYVDGATVIEPVL